VHWIYLSLHFDDVAFSCGGLVWELVQTGDTVSIWTVCAGEPTGDELSPFARELHARWDAGQNATARRRIEDLNSCRLLGADSRYFSIPDCIYRRHPQTGEFLYASNATLNGPLQPGDAQTISALKGDLQQLLITHVVLVCPLGLGNHVDHQLTRLAVEELGLEVWYYADFPYVLRCRAE
jgi:LmbE family N-acetylglucosaminyl deacetylase